MLVSTFNDLYKNWFKKKWQKWQKYVRNLVPFKSKEYDNENIPLWRRGTVDISSALETEDPGSNSARV
jgi:hypothetical protein